MLPTAYLEMFHGSILLNCYLHGCKVLGNHTVDRFASNLNNHCTRFNSKCWCLGTEGVNAFEQSLADECTWVVPAPRDVLRALQKSESGRSRFTCVIPL